MQTAASARLKIGAGVAGGHGAALGRGAHLPLQGLQVQTLLLQLVLLLLDLVHQLVDAPVLGRQEPLEADDKER